MREPWNELRFRYGMEWKQPIIKTVEQALCHLKIGTARFAFYDIATKKKVFNIDVTKPFFLLYQVYNGKFDSHGNPKFTTDNDVSQMLFKERILDKGFVKFFNEDVLKTYKKNVDVFQEAMNVKGLGDEFSMLVKEVVQLHSEHKFNNVNELVWKYNDKNGAERDEAIAEYAIISKDTHYGECTLEECVNHKAHQLRAGFAFRFEKKFGRKTNINSYCLDYLYVLRRGIWNEITSFEITTHEVEGLMVGELSKAPIYFSMPTHKAEYLSKIYNDFGHLAFGLDQAPKMITKLYEYNQKIPGFVMKDIINKEDFERLMRKNLIHDFASFNHIFRDDKELALTVIGNDVRAFKVLSNKLKNDPELYNHIPMNLLPIKARSDSHYMLGRENWLYPHIDNASKSLVADLDYLINCFVATGGNEYADDEDYQRQYTTANLQVAKKFPKSFIEELREVGEDPRIWGYAIPENYIGPPEGGTIINSKGELAFKQTHIKLNLKILCKIKKLRFNKKLHAELSSKETAPKRKNKI